MNKNTVESVDAKKSLVTAEIVKQIGHWNEEDATRALGTATHRYTPSSSGVDGVASGENAYVYSTGQITLIFKHNVLAKVVVFPRNLTWAEVKLSLGEGAHRELLCGSRTYGYLNSHLVFVVDVSDKVKSFGISDAEVATSLLSTSASWVRHLP